MSATLNPANIIWQQQISTQTKMACGARNPASKNEGNTLSFKVKIKSGTSHFIEIDYRPGFDDYAMKLIAVRGHKIVTEREVEGIYGDQLSEIIYNWCHDK